MNKECEDFIVQLQNGFIRQGWINVYSDDICCGLVKDDCVDTVMKRCDWEIHKGDIGVEIMGDNIFVGGTDLDVTPFVFRRFEPDAIELLQEFRLLYNLRRRQLNDGEYFYGKDENGDDYDVVKIIHNCVYVRLPFIKEYIAYKKRHLILYFDIFIPEISSHNVDISTIPLDNSTTFYGSDYVYEHTIIPCLDVNQCCDLLMGKCILRYNQADIKNLWEWLDEGFENFIIGCDDSGVEIEHTCDKNYLSNYFVKKEGEPLEVTPVFFRKEVLDKYYGNPDKYSVKDGRVACDKYWSIRIDNDRNDYVVTILVDLGKMPFKEQKYWKSFNVAPPLDASFSCTAYERWVNGKFCDTSVAFDLVFKQEFESFVPKWKEHFGWDLFLPLTEGDIHRYKALHCLTTESNESDFDEQIISITKLTIDSLNDKELIRLIKQEELPKDSKSIDKLEQWVKQNNFELLDDILFLRRLQALRSFNVAHRKSRDEKKRANIVSYFNLNTKNNQDVLNDIFIKMTCFLRKLEVCLMSNKAI